MKHILTILFILFNIYFSVPVFAQGCSDPGLCYISIPMDTNKTLLDIPIDEINNRYHFIKFSNEFGLGENNIVLNTTAFEYHLPITFTSKLFFRAPIKMIQGQLASRTAIGDIHVGMNMLIRENKNKRWIGMVAMQVPTSNADALNDSIALPMQYQGSLATLDIILRSTFIIKKYLVSIGYQQPIFHINKNMFNSNLIVDTSLTYFTSTNLKRGNNIMLRIDRYFSTSFGNIYFGILPILKLQKDKIKENYSYVSIDGSNGLTFNLTTGALINLSKYARLRSNVGMPLITRENRADGLMRNFVAMVAYEQSLFKK